MKKLSPTVFVLGMASFFTDLSSEMIYPLLPVFLSTVLGAGALQLGIIEGIAESTASLTKLISGLWTDRAARRKPFIVAGYSLAGLARPLIGLAQSWPAVLALRFTDRVGKGIRTSPRDAMIADVTEPGLRGRAYGFHRSMDHAGAVTGPAVAAYLLWELHVPLRVIFLWALIPSLVVIALLLTQLKENSREIPPPAAPISWALWNTLPANFKFFLLSVFVFSLGNSTDAFLLLKLKDSGVPAAGIAVLWSLHHIVKMTSTYGGGLMADRVNKRRLLIGGWIVYAAVYMMMGAVQSAGGAIALFLIYGLYFGLTEPVEKTMVSLFTDSSTRGTAFGFFHMVVGLAALPASLLFGWIWKTWSMSCAFSTGAALAGVAAVILLLVKTPSSVSLRP